MDITSLIAEFAGHLLPHMPGFIGRAIFSEEKLLRETYVRLRDINPVNFTGYPPRFDVYLEFDNNSNLDITIDRFFVDAWVGQPTATATCIVPGRIARRTGSVQLHAWDTICPEIARWAERLAATPSCPAHIHVTLVCKSAYREFLIYKQFPREAKTVNFVGLGSAPPTLA